MRGRFLAIAAAITVIAGVVLTATADAREQAYKLRISLDTTPTHVRTVWVQKYAEELRQRSNGRIEPEVFHSGQLFKDVNVAKALRQGSVEMAVPGTWVLGGFESRIDALALPMFYGRTIEETHAIADGPIGAEINAGLEDKLGVKVLGKWFDLGASHMYFTRPVTSYDDVKGLKVRYPGGASSEKRLEALGASPTLVPWPDVPLAMSRGNFEGLITTNESAQSAKLWESGLKSVFEDYQSVGMYIPLVAGGFWKKLPPELQQLMLATWDEMIPPARAAALEAQAEAGETLKKNGVVFTRPSREAVIEKRRLMMADQDQIASQLGIDKAFVARAQAALDQLD